MNNKETSTIMKLAETAILAALCYVSFTFLQIKIPVPGGDATSLHIGNAFCVLAALLLGGVYGGMAGAVGMTIADLMDPVYITGAPKTFVLKLCIGLITGLVAHKVAKINESTDKSYVFKWSLIASVAQCSDHLCECSCFCDPGCVHIQCTSSGTDQDESDPDPSGTEG